MSLVPAYEGNKPYIFVSYAHKDSDFVQPIIAELFEKKYRIWYDEGIAPGSEWPKNIADHLNNCKGVIAFVSEASINSKNCENEVVRATEKQFIRQFSVDGCKHRLLENAELVTNATELLSSIPDEYIGDGTGYDRAISKKKGGALWNALVAVAIVLAIATAVGLYGLNQGWFDKYLPALKEAENVVDESELLKAQEAEIEDAGIAKLIAEAAGRTDLTEEIQFDAKSEWHDFCDALGLDSNKEITVMDLQYLEQDYIYFDNATDQMLSYLKHLPNLKEIELENGHVTTLEELAACPKLEKVWVWENALPVKIPEAARFEVTIKN